MCGRGRLEHPQVPMASCSDKAEGALGAVVPRGALWRCLTALQIVADLGGHWNGVFMWLFKRSGSGSSSTLLLCFSCCFSLFRLLSGERWWQSGGVPSVPCLAMGVGWGSWGRLSVFSSSLESPGTLGSCH